MAEEHGSSHNMPRIWSADTSIVLSYRGSASRTMWAAVATCVARKLTNRTRFTCWILQLSWHCRSLSGITSTPYLEEEGKAFGSCAHASCAVAAPHSSRSDMTYTLLQQAHFSCPGKDSKRETSCVLTGSFRRAGRRSWFRHSQDADRP
jgi:hypothetical protein